MSAELTLGAEEELHLIDLESWSLSARAPQLLSRLPGDELLRRDPAHHGRDQHRRRVRLDELRTELVRLRRGLAEVAAAEGLGIAAVGTAPRSVFADFELTATGRYGRMQEQYRLLVDEQLICGLQVHVGVVRPRPGRADHAAGGPATCRSCSPCRPARRSGTGRTPATRASGRSSGSAGRAPAPTGRLESAAEYDELLDDLINSGVHRRPQDGLLRRPALGARARRSSCGSATRARSSTTRS